MEEKKPTNKRVYIKLPKKYVAAFSEHYELDHGLIVIGLNPYVNEGYVRAYFNDWGNVTACKITRNGAGNLAYVRFSTEDEADRAEWAGPHSVGGDVKVKRVVSPKLDGESEEERQVVVNKPRPRRSMGLGYILEDAQWLDHEMDNE